MAKKRFHLGWWFACCLIGAQGCDVLKSDPKLGCYVSLKRTDVVTPEGAVVVEVATKGGTAVRVRGSSGIRYESQSDPASLCLLVGDELERRFVVASVNDKKMATVTAVLFANNKCEPEETNPSPDIISQDLLVLGDNSAPSGAAGASGQSGIGGEAGASAGSGGETAGSGG